MVPSKGCSCVSEMTITRVEIVPGAMITVRQSMLSTTNLPKICLHWPFWRFVESNVCFLGVWSSGCRVGGEWKLEVMGRCETAEALEEFIIILR